MVARGHISTDQAQAFRQGAEHQLPTTLLTRPSPLPILLFLVAWKVASRSWARGQGYRGLGLGLRGTLWAVWAGWFCLDVERLNAHHLAGHGAGHLWGETCQVTGRCWAGGWRDTLPPWLPNPRPGARLPVSVRGKEEVQGPRKGCP